MPSYQSPGVYVEEVSILPPSVAEVGTAIPAFLGFTATTRYNGKDQFMRPVRITSFLDFVERFGDRSPYMIEKVVVDEASNEVQSVEIKGRFYLYDSLYMYFLNGGGTCYIVSLGTYEENSDPKKWNDLFLQGIKTLESEDDITLIAMPDVIQSGESMYSIFQASLQQCWTMKNRFTIMAIPEESGKPDDWISNIQGFRNRIGVNNLSYGAVYTPYVIGDISFDVNYGTVKGRIFKNGEGNTTPLTIADFDPKARETEQALLEAIAYETQIEAGLKDLLAKHKINANIKGSLWQCLMGVAASTELNRAVAEYLVQPMQDSSIESVSRELKQYHADMLVTALAQLQPIRNVQGATDLLSCMTESGTQEVENKTFDLLRSLVKGLFKATERTCQRLDDGLQAKSSFYIALINRIRTQLRTLPPDGAMAGVYAAVDRQRGVWKAPANVSLSSTLGLTRAITAQMQETLNIDSVAGKSVNVIRPFPGKGFLIWGARTLDGNSNEWRYIPVRRFFIMVEESVKRATFWAVFEPNDANLWVKVKAMVENFLLEQWKRGALAGASPADAFYVNVGLGSTMTAQDVLEGRLYVDIGMAVVRPAEFIILRFMHKIQQS